MGYWQLVASGRGRDSSLQECGPLLVDYIPVDIHTSNNIRAAKIVFEGWQKRQRVILSVRKRGGITQEKRRELDEHDQDGPGILNDRTRNKGLKTRRNRVILQIWPSALRRGSSSPRWTTLRPQNASYLQLFSGNNTNYRTHEEATESKSHWWRLRQLSSKPHTQTETAEDLLLEKAAVSAWDECVQGAQENWSTVTVFPKSPTACPTLFCWCFVPKVTEGSRILHAVLETGVGSSVLPSLHGFPSGFAKCHRAIAWHVCKIFTAYSSSRVISWAPLVWPNQLVLLAMDLDASRLTASIS